MNHMYYMEMLKNVISSLILLIKNKNTCFFKIFINKN